MKSYRVKFSNRTQYFTTVVRKTPESIEKQTRNCYPRAENIKVILENMTEDEVTEANNTIISGTFSRSRWADR